MKIPQSIIDLVRRFAENRDSYSSSNYNETQLRREFLDPFFEALGWDVSNKQGYAEAYKEVIHEDAVKIGTATKAPDYCFRIGGTRKFFVEAKKPFVNIKDEISPAFQLRRYAWSTKLSLSILTDFEEFAVYDCRQKPDKTDKASISRILYMKYDEYEKRWDEIVSIFSKDAILRGSFDRFAETNKAKKGTSEVDDSFLSEIENWRDILARNIAIRNESLFSRELNFAVQRTIDRLIFLRICEDRGIEDYGRLQAHLNGENIYKRLCVLFREADERYNSGLFHFREEKGREETPDTITLRLDIDDKILKQIIQNLYYPDSPYEFSVLPADILGQVYEQFLAKVIRLTAGHQAKVEDKPAVKKAGGVFYTPTYIVDYIVKNTVGKLLENKTPKQAASLRILDPACGSGSFLIGAYQHLLDWHRDWYTKNNSEKWSSGKNPTIYRARAGEYRLTTPERKKILLNTIYGVDIDTQAVEVTKLSLLLKVLEGENEQSIAQQLKLFHERALPDLGNNIKCGNSLIGTDFYEGVQETMALYGDEDEERIKINAFDWDGKDGFPEIVKDGGFDAVIGNPPYGASFQPNEIDYVMKTYKSKVGSKDSYELFITKAVILLKSYGYLGYIIPASWLSGESYMPSRIFSMQKLSPVIAYTMPFDVFKDAYIDTAIIVFGPAEHKKCQIHYFPKKEKIFSIPVDIGQYVQKEDILNDPYCRLILTLSKTNSKILKKLFSSGRTFGDWFIIQRGVQPYSRKKHSEQQIKDRFLHAQRLKTKDYLPELQGNELSRYYISPGRASYLHFCDAIASIRPIKMFQGPRIVLRRLLTRKFRLQASYASETLITTDNVLNVVPNSNNVDVYYALGVLNSKLISWLYSNTSMIAQKDDFPQVHLSALSELPIPVGDNQKQRLLVTLVASMLDIRQKLPLARTDHEKTIIQRQIDSIDQRIDELVYELYCLTEDEIKTVEGEK
jgi:type I restriction-modification system DNA methylase subunit/predicted type IV restriction endonuclease